MPSRKDMSHGAVAVPRSPTFAPNSNLPGSLRFPLLVILSLTLSASLYTLAADFSGGELAGISRTLNEWWEAVGLMGWRSIELGVGWWGGYDGVDLASLTLLSHLPPLYLATTFYSIRPTTVITSLAIDILSTYIPFRLLRPLSPTHNIEAPKAAVSNRAIINDLPVRTYTTLLAAGIYSVVVYGSYYSWLPVYLVTHFDGMRDISAAHSAALPYLLASFVPVGYAAREFLFTPSTGSQSNRGDAVSSAFNPESATLGETVKHNLWDYPKRTQVIIGRTATLVAVTGFNTWIRTYASIEGSEIYGAAGWAGVWAAGAATTGVALWWVGDV
ncbi:MAG: hypothetical protein M1836_007380 [Candelina mexicana]|nr:MAG: hypothetical protein M1836_007380 [Candelina mexicana]